MPCAVAPTFERYLASPNKRCVMQDVLRLLSSCPRLKEESGYALGMRYMMLRAHGMPPSDVAAALLASPVFFTWSPHGELGPPVMLPLAVLGSSASCTQSFAQLVSLPQTPSPRASLLDLIVFNPSMIYCWGSSAFWIRYLSHVGCRFVGTLTI